ncbi:hypothetical protein D3C83_92780 [compost metagenome]
MTFSFSAPRIMSALILAPRNVMPEASRISFLRLSSATSVTTVASTSSRASKSAMAEAGSLPTTRTLCWFLLISPPNRLDHR